jgi:hypothetical protein
MACIKFLFNHYSIKLVCVVFLAFRYSHSQMPIFITQEEEEIENLEILKEKEAGPQFLSPNVTEFIFDTVVITRYF